MTQVIKSFERGRKELLVKMSAKAGQHSVRKVIPFSNNDVPNYLRELAKFEQASRKANLLVG